MMFNQPTGSNNTNVSIRFAVASSNSGSSSSWTKFGPTGASGYILDGHSHNLSSSTISEMKYCEANQYIGVMYAREARTGKIVEVTSGHSNFTAKLLFVD